MASSTRSRYDDFRLKYGTGNVEDLTARHIKDGDSVWSWGVQRKWCNQEWAEKIEPRFEEWSNLTWAEVDGFASDTGHRMHHNMDYDAICDEAQ